MGSLQELCTITCKSCGNITTLTYTENMSETYDQETGECDTVYYNELTFSCDTCGVYVPISAS